MSRVSTLDTLNDPFELMPYLRYGEKEKIRRYMEVRKQISDIYGLLCFSRTWEEPLLWSNYADKHKGIAIGFEINSSDIFNVVYDPNPIRKQFDLTSDISLSIFPGIYNIYSYGLLEKTKTSKKVYSYGLFNNIKCFDNKNIHF